MQGSERVPGTEAERAVRGGGGEGRQVAETAHGRLRGALRRALVTSFRSQIGRSGGVDGE